MIPDSVTRIGNAAFANCEGLTSVTIGSNVTEIDTRAFASCAGLTSVALPDSVTRIGYEYTHDRKKIMNGAFEYCENIIVTHLGLTYSYQNIEELYRAF